MLFEKNIDSLSAALDKSVQTAMLNYEQLQETGHKGELACIYISFLRSSVLCKLPWLRVDLCDENGRNDLPECFAALNVPAISEKIYSEADKIKEQKSWTRDYQVQQAWINASGRCFQMFEKYFPQIINRSEASKITCCKWHFGQFLGNTVVVWEGGKGEA